MVNLAEVIIWDVRVGVVSWSADRGFATFEYDPIFLNKGWDLAPITMSRESVLSGQTIYSFPSLNPDTYRGLPGMLADSLPDAFGNNLIEAWLAQNGRNPDTFNPVERLCYLGIRGMGALEYKPALRELVDTSAVLEIDRLVHLANTVFADRQRFRTSLKDKPTEGLMDIIRVGTSAGGARAKAIIAYNDKTGDVRSGQITGLPDYHYWIIKFDGVFQTDLGNPQEFGKIEYAYYLMANACGIQMTICQTLKENMRTHFITRRFDRDGARKIHMQTLCAIAHLDYNNPDAYSYEQAFQIMRQLKLPYADAEELFRRMCFNVIARNLDDHTKNISFLMDQTGAWRLSPAYDVTYAYDPAHIWMKAHQLSINGKHDDIIRTDLLGLAKKMNIKRPLEIIERITTAVGHWPEYAQEAEVSGEKIKAIGKTHLVL